LKSMRASFILGQFCYLRLLSIHYQHPLILKKFWFALSNSLHPFVNECSKETHTKCILLIECVCKKPWILFVWNLDSETTTPTSI
jgi:hypothetical protein